MHVCLLILSALNCTQISGCVIMSILYTLFSYMTSIAILGMELKTVCQSIPRALIVATDSYHCILPLLH